MTNGYIHTIKQQLEIPSAYSWAAPVRATGTVWKRKRQAVRTIPRVQNQSCWVTLLQLASRAAELGRPLLEAFVTSICYASSFLKYYLVEKVPSNDLSAIKMAFNIKD